MTEKLCGPKGLLEVEEGGDMYLTVRYYLSQFVTDVVFEERLGGAYESLSPVIPFLFILTEGTAVYLLIQGCHRHRKCMYSVLCLHIRDKILIRSLLGFLPADNPGSDSKN